MITKEKKPAASVTAEAVVLHGTGIGTGKACGRLRFMRRMAAEPCADASASAKKSGSDASVSLDTETELARLYDARRMAAEQIKVLRRRAEVDIGAEEAQIFEIHGMLLEDEDFTETMDSDVRSGMSAEMAVSGTVERFAAMMKGLEDPYMQARAADMKDIGARLLRILAGESAGDGTGANTSKPYILVADDLSPSETVAMDRDMILGFVTFGGTVNSHTAILARAMGIPALVNVGEVGSGCDGKLALLDAHEGTLVVDPAPDAEAAFVRAMRSEREAGRSREAYLRSLLGTPAVTRGGHTVMIYANVGSPDEVPAALAGGAEGIGLLRSEFLYLAMDNYPTEEMLYTAYRRVVEGMQGRRVIIRTLDIGADKRIPYFGLDPEENPALGYRGVRICLDREGLFKTQLRAVLRASAHGRVAIMIPMVVSVDEVRRCRKLMEVCYEELLSEGRAMAQTVEFGIMVETPAAAIMSEELASEVDFFSVGTNDLSQYTLAADRQNPAVARIARDNVEPLLRLVGMAARAIHAHGGWIGICGELAADPMLTQKWVNMKIDELSVSPPYLLDTRGRVTECE